MTYLIIGMAFFFGVHLLSLTPARAPLMERFGDKAYKGVYSVIAIVGLGLMIWGFALARSGPAAANIVYNPIEGGQHATMLFVLLAMILLASAHMKGYLRKIVKHPMSVGVGLWAVGHLLANGNLSEVLLFGGFLVLSVLDIIVSTVRGKLPDYQPEIKYDAFALFGGCVIYALFLSLHQTLFSVSPIY
jgi:uncharacterized membrane protein